MCREDSPWSSPRWRHVGLRLTRSTRCVLARGRHRQGAGVARGVRVTHDARERRWIGRPRAELVGARRRVVPERRDRGGVYGGIFGPERLDELIRIADHPGGRLGQGGGSEGEAAESAQDARRTPAAAAGDSSYAGDGGKASRSRLYIAILTVIRRGPSSSSMTPPPPSS